MSEKADGRRRGGALVGRAAERETIDTLLADAEDAPSGALVFAGPPGIGKSALVQYAIDSASGFRVLRVTGVESEMAFGYAGVHQLVLLILESARDLPEPQRAALDAVLGTAQHDALDPFLVGLAVLSLVAEAARASPSSSSSTTRSGWTTSRRWRCRSSGRRLHAERVAMLVTVREHPSPRSASKASAGSTSAGCPPEALDLLTAAAAGPVDESVAGRIVAATQGNPLALVELPAALTVEQLRGTAPLPDPLPIGERLSGLFAARVRALDADASDGAAVGVRRAVG